MAETAYRGYKGRLDINSFYSLPVNICHETFLLQRLYSVKSFSRIMLKKLYLETIVIIRTYHQLTHSLLNSMELPVWNQLPCTTRKSLFEHMAKLWHLTCAAGWVGIWVRILLKRVGFSPTGQLSLVWFERSLHSAQVSGQSCPWPWKLMTSQAVESYRRLRGKWVN